MSLINEMLRDLEKRKASNEQAFVLPGSTDDTEARRTRLSPYLGLAAALVVAGMAYRFYPAPQKPLAKPVMSAQKTNAALKLKPLPLFTAPHRIPVLFVQASPLIHARPVITAERIRIKTSPEPKQTEQPSQQPAELLYRLAMGTPSPAAAIAKLEKALRLDPRHLNARLLMAKTLHQQGQLEKTAQFLDESLMYFPDHLQFINTRAQIQLQQKNPAAALNTLQRGGLKTSSNEVYLSLLAAAYSQLHADSDAASVYEQLIRINPEKSANWLGLAIAYDALGKEESARTAYLNALNKNSADPAVVSYIKQRLSALQ